MKIQNKHSTKKLKQIGIKPMQTTKIKVLGKMYQENQAKNPERN
jgi:hypothetical protein